MRVYLVRNSINGKRYVGQTMFPVEERWVGHLSYARRGSDLPLHRAIRKYGAAAFEVTVVLECANRAELDRAEIEMIVRQNALVPTGYNLASGGTQGYVMSEETRAKIGAALRDRKFRPETIARFKEAHSRQWENVRAKGGISPEEKANRSAGQKARRPYFERVRLQREALSLSI